MEYMEATHSTVTGGPLDKGIWAIMVLLSVLCLILSIVAFSSHQWRVAVVTNAPGIPGDICSKTMVCNERFEGYGLFHFKICDTFEDINSCVTFPVTEDSWDQDCNSTRLAKVICERKVVEYPKDSYESARKNRGIAKVIIAILYCFAWVSWLFGLWELRKLGQRGNTKYPQGMMTAGILFLLAFIVYAALTSWSWERASNNSKVTIGAWGRDFWLALSVGLGLMFIGFVTNWFRF
eukprot:TRINITY_DN71538_c0_g1_i1.p1 TRINITY_DN71538_c0_g1~~TRINITY_DN71538_c0_g1_i1.p1  ORF type:complete len:252 (-),score=33.18 TRINITY_DN71538_c0_g1_i1:205-912(-)